ncbi:putative casparian strip membrane protein [Helianthus annuus]|nr:putative casparian strip membrane protein [Helianthus annuus]KAJ0460931.1 putative casparian strip membrane protein [Helianthus annuus]KAJ0641362.1 putative casparian strip membrane protein [Helianthus annuus]KAJ0645259.1 putative casparian strip membrane protein [Helianthus annuus]
MSYLGVGVSPGNVPVYHIGTDVKDVGRKVRLAELILRSVVCVLALVSALLVATNSQVQEIFTIQKKAKFTDMKALVFLVVVNAMAAAYSLVQVLRCGLSVVRGSVVLSKPLAWLILSSDQLMAYVMLAALGAALQSAIFAKFAEPELQWMKVCDMYGKFCNRSGEGIACSAVAWLMMVIVTGISSFSLFRLYGGNKGTKIGAGW